MSKIVIEVNNYFTKEKWQKKLKALSELKEHKFVFVDSESKLINQIIDADVCFLLSFSNNIDFSISRIEMLYMGISDIDFLDLTQFPESLKLFFARGFSSQFIAEYALMASLYLTRNIENAVLNQVKRIWDQNPFLSQSIKSLDQYRIGVLGLGSNGMAIVKTFNNLGCKVSGFSLKRKKAPELNRWYSREELDSLLQDNEIIIVALPLRTDTFNLLNFDKFQLMGNDSYLINTSRSQIVNEYDLVKALNSNVIKAAAIDVCSIEDLTIGRWWRPNNASREKSKLWKTKNLLITPHIAGNANYFVDMIQDDFISKL